MIFPVSLINNDVFEFSKNKMEISDRKFAFI